ncbi:DUF87 domain-containing protein [Candidatus Bipolaricaulota bacterium]|nr:DUF87 domain-containing protein [Candidatus Bipolaricaulota bacterium]
MGIPLQISKDLQLDLEDIIGQCIAILGIRGSGKSNTAGVIFEELLRNNYPLSIIDIDGEYFGLKEKYEILVVGTGEGVEIEVDPGCAREVAEISMEKNVPVVVDLSGFLSEERTEFLREYLTALWTLAGKLRRPYIIGIEEAHEFIPQAVRGPVKELVTRVALRGRKRGLGAIIISQRSAKVEKDVLSQAGMLFLHRVVHEADMRVYSEILPWRKTEVKEIITGLETGDCVFVNGDSVLPIYVRERETFHAGFTPSLDVVVTPELRQVSQSILEVLERAKKAGQGRKSEADALRERIEELMSLIGERDGRIQELEEVARTLGYIRVEVQSTEDVGVASAHAPRRYLEEPSSEEEVAEIAAPPAGEEREYRTLMLQPPEHVIDIPMEDENVLPPAVRRQIERIVQRISRTSLVHRRMLAFALSHAPNSYSVEQIAAWIDCAAGVMLDEPPRQFLDMGLIVQERRAGSLYYRSDLNGFVNREFRIYEPDLRADDLRAIVSGLRAGICGVGAIPQLV